VPVLSTQLLLVWSFIGISLLFISQYLQQSLQMFVCAKFGPNTLYFIEQWGLQPSQYRDIHPFCCAWAPSVNIPDINNKENSAAANIVFFIAFFIPLSSR
jgi:hypothetical protein